MSSCPWKIHWGPGQEHTTQCDKPEHLWDRTIIPAESGRFRSAYRGDPGHRGPSGVQPGQIITWQVGDRREYTGPWPGPCTKTQHCTLHAGHHGRCAI